MATIANVAPAVVAGPDLTVTVSQTVSLPPATFFDPGLGDTHTFEVDWGNGSVLSGTVAHVNGHGEIADSNVYFNPGQYSVSICVTDDDGDEGCDTFVVAVNLPDLLNASKWDGLQDDADGSGDVSPGDTMRYTVTMTNDGAINAVGAVLSDTLDLSLSPVPGSVNASQGVVLDGNDPGDTRVVVDVGLIAPGGQATVTFDVTVANPLPAGVVSVSNQATIWGGNFFTVVSDDPDTPALQDPTVTPIVAAPDLQLTTDDLQETVAPGQYLIYRLTMTNMGNQAAAGLVVTGTVPANTGYAGADYSGALSGTVVSWTIPSLLGGESVFWTMVVQVDAPLPGNTVAITHTARVLDDRTNGPDLTADNSDGDVDDVNLDPDLAAAYVDPAGSSVDAQNLALSGSIDVSLRNQGGLAVTAPFSLTLFEDSDADGLYTPLVDNPLGGLLYGDSLAPSSLITLPVPVSATVAFRDNLVHAYVDSDDVVVELSEANNVADSSLVCTVQRPTGSMDVVVELSWPPEDEPLPAYDSSRNSMSTPLVVQLTDDSGDGLITTADTPDIVFVSFSWTYGCGEDSCGWFDGNYRLRAITGDTGDEIFSLAQSGYTYARSGLAAGDIDGDGIVEILTTNMTTGTTRNRILAYEHDGTLKWISASFYAQESNTGTDRTNPAIADLDGDGVPEIIAGANVINADGTLRWSGGEGQAWQAINNYPPGALFSSRSGAVSIVADLDLDGVPEVVTGKTAYRNDGTIYWHLEEMDDGYPAVGNFDDDVFPEIVVVSRGFLRLHEHTGELKWGPFELPGSDPEPGGPPTVADFDADGEPEIGLAGSSFYVVYETDGSLKWQSNAQDASSGMTGSTVFDLDGDGDYEVIYRDEQYLRIYQGSDGTVLYQYELSSATVNEMPVVADVDNDGSAEIIVSSDELRNRGGTFIRTRGIRVLGNPNWASTRAIWNQHAYHVSNVTDEGGIPAETDWWWLEHNTFRANLDPNISPHAAPDATVSYLRADTSNFPELHFIARVGNGGAAPLAAGLPVAFYDGDPAGSGTLIGVAYTGGALLPGAYEDVVYVWDTVPSAPGEVWAVVDDDGAGGEQGSHIAECREDNNQHNIAYDVAGLGLALSIDDGLAALNAGDINTYTLTLANARPISATGVVISATLPADTFFQFASHGGVESGGVVSWPAVTLPANHVATRTLVVQVDPVIPLAVRFITTTAGIADDGAAGADPSPWNNQDEDTDRVLTVDAKAGGPYSAIEGDTIAVDSSGSSDRDGTVMLYEWDLDADGLYDDAAGITATLPYSDDLDILIGLRVTDDSGEQDHDTARLTFLNAPPVVVAGGNIITVEGSLVSLEPALFTDIGVLDTHTATVNWDDGTVENANLLQLAGGGVLSSAHIYQDDALYNVRACAEDDDGGLGCNVISAAVSNVPPLVDAGPDRDILLTEPMTPTLTDFFEPGALDTHAAEISWGDGMTDTGSISYTFSSPRGITGTALFPSHLYTATGVCTATVCLTDDDAGVGCDPVLVNVTTIEVDGSGPLTSNEGEAVSFTGVYTDPTNTPPYTYTWHFDDGDMATGYLTATHTYVDDGAYNASLIVENGAGLWGRDFVPVAVANLPPAVMAGPAVTITEWMTFTLSGATFVDPGVLDSHIASIDWGDGSSSFGIVNETGGAGTVSGEHHYADDGVFTVEVCVQDNGLAVGCDSLILTVTNVPPEIRFALQDIHSWVQVNLNGNTPNWIIAADGRSARQSANVGPTILMDPDSEIGTRIETRVTPGADNDFFGFVFGIQPGDESNPNAEYLLVDWKRATQSLTGTACGNVVASRGLALSRVTGQPHNAEFWDHQNLPCTPGSSGVEELTRGATLGNSAWGSSIDFIFEYGANWLRFYVDDVLEIDYAGPIPEGRFSFYTYSQPTVTFWDPEVTGPVGDEGSAIDLFARYTDVGLLDTHTGQIDWGDGAVEPGNLQAGPGAGVLTGTHSYPDDGLFPGLACVTDDDGGAGCRPMSSTIYNVAPDVTAAPSQTVTVNDPFTIQVATFSDPGVLDTHTATIDWGDGTVTSERVGKAGEGMGPEMMGVVNGTHTYTGTGNFTVAVTVLDDDGGEGSDTLQLTATEDPTANSLRGVTARASSAWPAAAVAFSLLYLVSAIAIHNGRAPIAGEQRFSSRAHVEMLLDKGRRKKDS